MRALRLGKLLAALLALTWVPAALAQSSEEEAGDVSEVDKDRLGPLRERVRPVSGHLFLKEGRFELSPSITASLKDAFFTKYVFGLTATYHPVESFGINARFGYALSIVSGAAQICTTEGLQVGCRTPTMDELTNPQKRAQGQIILLGGLDGEWAPIYGKLSLSAEKFLHFDLYAILGGSAVQYGSSSGPTLTFGGNAGLGMRIFMNKWMAIRTELRDLIYVEKTSTGAELLRNQMMFELGLSMFFPTTFQEG